MSKDLEKLAKQLDANQLKKQLMKRLGVRSEKELIKKALGTDDMKEAKRILAQKLKNSSSGNPLLKVARSQLDGKKAPSLSKRDLNRVLSPQQKLKLKRFLDKNK